jgi:hypothetical protein
MPIFVTVYFSIHNNKSQPNRNDNVNGTFIPDSDGNEIVPALPETDSPFTYEYSTSYPTTDDTRLDNQGGSFSGSSEVETPGTSLPTSESLAIPPPNIFDSSKVPTHTPLLPEKGTSAPNEILVLSPNESLAPGQFRSSPSGEYKVGLTKSGDLVLQQNNESLGLENKIIWSAGTTGEGVRCFFQSDGNLIVRSAAKVTLWTTDTHDYPGARLLLDDSGQLAIKVESTDPSFTKTKTTTVWLEGVPRANFVKAASDNLSFPVRGTFYYP